MRRNVFEHILLHLPHPAFFPAYAQGRITWYFFTTLYQSSEIAEVAIFDTASFEWCRRLVVEQSVVLTAILWVLPPPAATIVSRALCQNVRMKYAFLPASRGTFSIEVIAWSLPVFRLACFERTCETDLSIMLHTRGVHSCLRYYISYVRRVRSLRVFMIHTS